MLSLYLKGYGAAEVKSQVQVTFHDRSVGFEGLKAAIGSLDVQAENSVSQVNIVIPDLQVDDPSKRLLKLTISPLYGSINTESSSHRVVSSKVSRRMKINKTRISFLD